MLQNIHDKAKGWVAYAIVGFIAVPFALFGISSYLDGGGASLVAATVNGEDIPVQEVQNAVLQQRQRMAQLFGGKLPSNVSENVIKQQALEQAVNQVLLRQESEKNGYRASNQEVYDVISAIPAFQKDGQFDAKTYELMLASQRRNKSNFEIQVRENISNQQFVQAVNNTTFIPPQQVALYQGLQNQLRDVETLTLKKSDYKSQVNVSEDEIKSQFDSNASNYMTPEKVKLSYVLLEQSELAKSLTVENNALRSFYDENLNRYIDPEQRKIAHILVKVTDDKQDQAKAKAQAFYDQIQTGTKTFEELASLASDDKLAAGKNGEIGLITKGDMGERFDKEAFALNLAKDDISKVIKTEAGYEIIKILDIIPAKNKPFDDVKTELEELYRSEQAEKLFLDQSDKLQTLAFENDSSLDEAADAAGVKVQSSEWLQRINTPDEKNILLSPKVIAAAFSDDVLTAGKNSELIEINEGTVLVVRLEDHKLPAQKPLADVKEEINTSLLAQKLKKLLIEKGDLALKALKDSGQWSVLENIGATKDKIESNTGVKRNDTKLPPSILSKLFSMQKPELGKKSFDNAILPDGNYVLMALSAVKDGATDIDISLQRSYTQMLASREQSAVIKALREQAEVELFPKNIQ